MGFTNEEKTFLVFTYLKSNYHQAKADFEAEFEKPAPTHRGLKVMADYFREHGTVVYKREKGRSGRILTAIEEARELFEVNPRTSTRHAALQLQIGRTTVQKILKHEFRFHPYKDQKAQFIPDGSNDARLEFARDFSAFMDNNFITDLIIFTDESHFPIDGYSNPQNDRTWAAVNPHVIREQHLHARRVTVWCGVSSRGIIGPFFFHDTITSEMYLEMLQNDAIPALDRYPADLTDMWFQQDGATIHTTPDVLDYLNETFGGNVISRKFPERHGRGFMWPPYSPDLTPCDFFLWGAVKDKVYANGDFDNIADLMEVICEEVAKIDIESLKATIESFKYRLQLTIEEEGGHIKHRLKSS